MERCRTLRIPKMLWVGIALVASLMACLALPPAAFAAPDKEAYCITGNRITYYDSFSKAWAAAQNNSTVGITKNVELGKFVIFHNKGTVNLELNGHKLYKSKKKQSNIITVSSGSTLNIYGGRLNWSVVGSTVKFDNSVLSGSNYSAATGLASNYSADSVVANNTAERMPLYLKASNGSWGYTTMDNPRCTYKGGMIAGGWSSGDGGAIRLEGDSSRVKLTNVYLMGNTAENNGGAIAMNGSYQRVELDNSTISFNRAISKNGGGVYMGGNFGKLSLKKSHIEFNLADDNGGGVSATGEGCTVWGDAKAVDPSDKAYPSTRWQNKDMYNGDTFYNPYFRNGQMFAGEYLRTQENADAASTIAMNIVPDCDLNGGGGGVHAAAEKVAVAGLNIFRNYAGGSGVTSTWRGRGGGVELKKVKSSVSNCNIWKNWSRSEGGGVYVDNDKCSVSNITVTENYAHSNGWSGGGVYVLGTVNLAISGVCRIWGNTSAESGTKTHSDNLYLGYYNTMYARLYPELAKGSKIYLWMSGAGTTITKVKGDYDERMFYADESNWHVEYTSDKTLSLVKGKGSDAYLAEQYPPLKTTTLTPDGSLSEGSRTAKTDKVYKTAGNETFAVYRGVTEFPAFEDGAKDRTSTFFYSDGYFFDDPKNYQSHLATLSIHLAAASFYSNDGNQGGVLYGNQTGDKGKSYLDVEGDRTYYPVKSNNIRQFMSDIGIPESNIYLNDFNIQKPGPDTIGVAIGSKTLKGANGEDTDKTLVVIGVRGAGYEQEWISNLTLGNKGEAQGFSSAAKQVFAELNKYLNLKDIDGSSENTIFWVAGYSRAGATSNLTGKRIVDKYDNACKRTFVYTFEAPQGGSIDEESANSQKEYPCIHNVINEVDIVPKVGPSDMGFFRYGVDHYVPGSAPSSETSTSTYYNYPSPTDGKTYKTWRDNKVEKPGSSAYEANKKKMLKQLRAISGYNIIFNDYYHAATMQFLANKLFGNLGTQLIGEKNSSHVPKDAGAFSAAFLRNLMQSEFKYQTRKTEGHANKNKFYRYNYSSMSREGETFEKAIGTAAGVVFSLSPAQMQGLAGIGSTIMDRIDLTDFYLKFLNGSRSTRDVANEIWKALSVETAEGRAKGYVYLQDYLTKDQMKALGAAFPSLCDVLLNYLRHDYDATGCDWVGTFGYNAMRILQTHYPEISISWVRSYDNYYDNETTAYDVASSAKITSKDGWHVAAKATKLTHNYPYAQLYVSGGAGREPDENKGASLYYWLDDDKTLHPYCGPIQLSASDTAETSHTIKAFSIHDGIMTTPQTINITVDRPDQIKWPLYGENPSSTTAEQTSTERTEIGKTYQFEAPETIGSQYFKGWHVKYSYLDPTKGNRVYSEFNTNSGTNHVQSTLYAYLPGFDLTNRKVNFVVDAMGEYEFTAQYTDGIRSVAVTLGKVESGKPLPDKSTVSIAGQNGSEAKTEWQNDGNEYTVVVTLPRKGYDPSLQATVERHADNQNFGGPGVTVVRKGNAKVTTDGTKWFVSQRVRLNGYKEATPPDNEKRKVTLSTLNLNRGEELGQAQVLEGEQGKKAGEPVKIQLPKRDGYAYLRMLQQSETNGFEISKLNYKVVDDQDSPSGKSIEFEMINENVSLVAGYVPEVNKVSVVLDRNLEAGKTRPNVKWVDFGIGETDKHTWRIESGFNESWDPKSVQEKGAALGFNKKYYLRIMRTTNSTDALKGYEIGSGQPGTTMPIASPGSDGRGLIMGQSLESGSPSGKAVEMTGQFKLANNITYEVCYLPEAEESASAEPVRIELDGSASSTQSRWGTCMSFAFKPTRAPEIVDVLDPEIVELEEYADASSLGTQSLPSTATALYEDGSSIKVPVTWGDLEINTFDDADDEEQSRLENGYIACADGTLESSSSGSTQGGTGGEPAQGNTPGVDIPEALRSVLGVIVVPPQPYADEPWGYLDTGNAYGPAEDFTDVISVGADESTSVKLELYAEDDFNISYQVVEGDSETQHWNWSLYDDADGIEIGWGDNANVKDGATKTVRVEALAYRSGYNPSELVEYEFKLVKVPSTVTYAVTTKAVCAGTELFATTTGGGEYTSGTTVPVSAPASFAAGDKVYRFKNWTAEVAAGVPAVQFANPDAASTSFKMPKGAVAVTAAYEMAEIVAEPTSNLAPGAYALGEKEAGKQLVLSAAKGAEIHYTLASDGSDPAEPTVGSPVYDKPLTLTADAGQTRTYKVKALAVQKAADGSAASSAVASFDYSITRAQPSYQVSTVNGLIENMEDATSILDDSDDDQGAVVQKATFAKESRVTVAADDIADKVFKEWSANGLALDEAQKTKARMSFVMPGNDVALTAVFADKLNAITITGFDANKKFSDNIEERPGAVTYTTNVSSTATTAPLAWEKGETVTNPDGTKTTGWTASFTVTNTNPGFADAVQVGGDAGWSVTKATGTSVTVQKQVSYTNTETKEYAVKVLCYDTNINRVVDVRTYDFIEKDLSIDAGNSQLFRLFIDAPAVEDESITGWMEQGEALSGLDEDSDWALAEGSTTTTTDGFIRAYAQEAGSASAGATIEFPDGATHVVVVAKYVPVINQITIDVDEPVASYELADRVNSVEAAASELYASLPVGEGGSDVMLADMMDIAWSKVPSAQAAAAGSADFNATYLATLSIKPTYKGNLRFVVDPDASITVNDIVIPYADLEFDANASSFADAKLSVEFTTEKARVLAISAPADVMVSNSDTTAWQLPATVNVVTEAGSCQVPVTWNLAGMSLTDSRETEDGTMTVDTYTVPGEVNLPDTIDDAGHSLSVEVTVRNNMPVPESAAPTSSLEPGTYHAKQQLKLSAHEDASIYYTLGNGNPADDLEYDDSEGVVLEGEPGQPIEHTVRATAVETGKRPSTVAEFAYTIALPENVDSNALVDAIIAAKKAEEGVKTSPDGADVLVSEQYTTAAERKALDDAIAAAQKVADNPNATQEEVDKATVEVKAATDAFNKAKKAGKKPSYGPGEDPNQMGEDGTALGKGASAAAAERAILAMPNDADPAGSKIMPLKLRSKKQGKKSIKAQWSRVAGAQAYVLYGNACGKKNKMTKLATTTKASFNVKKIGRKKLKAGTFHKFIVVALDANNNVISTSKVIHVATKGKSTRVNPKKVTATTKAVKQARKLNPGKSVKLGAKAVGPGGSKVAKHIGLRYESSNPEVASVNGKGMVKAKSPGQAKITVYAQNGVSKTVKVTVK